ncbi:MAG: hypothetical protein M3403_05005, partial [Gemmatimonadota bacterium]|nr:hypothetical protein [Gemmatimonadota bacterium]
MIFVTFPGGKPYQIQVSFQTLNLGLIRLGFLLFPFFVTLAGAQGRPTTLDTVRVSITRDSARSPLLVPFAVSVLRPDSSRPG